jgi:hopanoid biosynthesis associated RND transporter like protein HpnN
VRRPVRVVVVSLLLTVAAMIAGLQVEFRTSRAELAPPDDPDQIRMSALLDQNAGTEALIACIETESGEPARGDEIRAFVQRLAEEFAQEPTAEAVFYRFNVDWFLDRLIYLLPIETLEKVHATLASQPELLEGLATVDGLTRFNEAIASWLEAGRQAGQLETFDPAEAGAALDGLARLLEGQNRLLESPQTLLAELKSGALLQAIGGEQAASLLSDGFLTTRDRQLYFIVLTPNSADDSLLFRRGFIRSMRERAERVQRMQPGFRVSFTGQPATVVEEMDTVRADTWRTSILAVVGVTLLTLFVFRWRAHAFLVLGALAVGVVMSFGAVLFEFGYLNMITSSFISTLIGIGVAYGIHPVSEYELEGAHTKDPEATIVAAFRRTGAGVTVAAITTSVAFLSIQLMRFRGFAELGIVAGVGVLFCLGAAVITLPAFLSIYARRRQRLRAEGAPRAAVVDRVWVELASDRICNHPKTVSVLALMITAAAAWAATGLSFSTNILKLLPRDAESVRYQERMLMESDLAPFYNIVVANDLAGLDAMRQLTEGEASISRFESPLDFLPLDGALSAQWVERLRPMLAKLKLTASEPGEFDPQALAAALARVESALADSVEDAFVAGLVDLVEPLERAREAAERGATSIRSASESQLGELAAAEGELLAAADQAFATLRRSFETEPPSVETLPEELRARFTTRSGEMLGFLHPAGAVFDRQELRTFVDASRRVSPEVTGFPLVFDKMSRRITDGFFRAVIVGAILVALILLLDFRKLRDAMLALSPLAMGVIWMMGGMRLLDLSFNFANLVAVPLIIGVGIDNGVHVIHRVRLEGREGMSVVLRHTGRAILIASLTTMIGFGSLALASHQGIASLGLVLLLGVGSCLITSTVVLPNLLVALGWVER